MSIMDEVALIKKKIENLTIKLAKYQERRESEEREKEKLLEEARGLGVTDTTKLSEWVEQQKQSFAADKEKILALIAEAESVDQ